MTIAKATILEGHVIDVLAGLPAGSVHSCMTSPPYWGLRNYDTPPQVWGGDPSCPHDDPSKCAIPTRRGDHEHDNFRKAEHTFGLSRGATCSCGAWIGDLGLEPTIELYIEHLLSVFEAVRRVLRDDGLLFVNMGDSYGAGKRTGAQPGQGVHKGRGDVRSKAEHRISEFDGGQLCNVPHRFAMRMQAAGWWLRSTIVWAKGISFCPDYAGSVMPESVSGTRWERCRVKVGAVPGGGKQQDETEIRDAPAGKAGGIDLVEWADCPGCDKCKGTDGYVLKRGSWRSTSGYELIFQFAKSTSYYCDAEAVQETSVRESSGNTHREFDHKMNHTAHSIPWEGSTRNPRSVWAIPTQAYPDAHFATWPEALVEPMIRVSTSEKGVCPECGAQWARIVDRTPNPSKSANTGADMTGGAALTGNPQTSAGLHRNDGEAGSGPVTTLGWRPTCSCDTGSMIGPEYDEVPAVVLDPFCGSGTTLLVARKLGRHSIGIELNPEYAAMARKRLDDYAPLFTGAAE